MTYATHIERTGTCDLLITRRFSATAPRLFAAWTHPAQLLQWWVPKSCGLSFVSCEADVRPGGAYRFVFTHPDAPQPMAFFGHYVDVVPDARLVWTNDEAGTEGPVTTVSFQADGEQTQLCLQERYPTAEALERAMASGSSSGFAEAFEQLDGVLAG